MFCLFEVFASHSNMFQSYDEVTITGRGFQILTYTWHSWPLRDFSVLYVLWHGASVYNCHLRGTMTITTVAERLEKGAIPTTYVCSDRDSNIFRNRGDRSNRLHHRGSKNAFKYLLRTLVFFLSTFSPKRNLTWLVENKLFNHRTLMDCNIIRPVIVSCTLI